MTRTDRTKHEPPPVGSKWRDRRRTHRVVEVVANDEDRWKRPFVEYRTVEPKRRARLLVADVDETQTMYLNRFHWSFTRVEESTS